jgi:uncharacterized OsmC-like protein
MTTIKTVQVNMSLGPKFEMEGRVRGHTLRVDQPATSGGEDKGPTPLEYFFVSLAGCLGTLGRIVANQRRLSLRSMEVQIQGPLDVEVLLGKGSEGRVGFQEIKALVKIDGDMTPDEKREFVHEIDRRCPISDNISAATPLSVELVE